ncbi:hypothetical protein [Lysobacter sp. Root690]|uniref:hypothetical protein n=1 Tax=Lysobacter sp. Root690 TaxID=1736588 RepID=UPI0006F47633|nr:hypothetical protein [Lysobacter sp. Root690]KRB11031.1 hypothetical protein ASD86_00850 [Lysobacter sp. Root690]
MSGLWSAQQREWLQAMGHTVMSLAGSEPPAEAPIANAASADSARGAEPDVRGSQPARERVGSESVAPERGASERAAAHSGQTAPRAANAGDDTPTLLRNLLRAARRAAGDAQVLALFDPSLRGNAAAKRALWPQLRKLRRTDKRG